MKSCRIISRQISIYKKISRVYAKKILNLYIYTLANYQFKHYVLELSSRFLKILNLLNPIIYSLFRYETFR